MDRVSINGALAGSFSAILFLFTAFGQVVMAFAFLAPLPLFIAGFGWGRQAVLVGAGTGTVIAALGAGPFAGFVFLTVVAVAPVVLVSLALICEETPDGPRWYPTGHLLGWLAGLAAIALLLAWLVAFGRDGGLQGVMTSGLNEMADAEPSFKRFLEDLQDATATGDQKLSWDHFLAIAAWSVLSGSAMLWVFSVGGCALAGQWLARKAGQEERRPPFDLQRMDVPNIVGVFLAAAVALAMIQGKLAFVGGVMVTIFALPFFITGLVTIHTVMGVWFRQMAGDNPVKELQLRLIGMVALLFLFLILWGLLLFLISIVGLIDQQAGIRRQALAASGGEESM